MCSFAFFIYLCSFGTSTNVRLCLYHSSMYTHERYCGLIPTSHAHWPSPPPASHPLGRCLSPERGPWKPRQRDPAPHTTGAVLASQRTNVRAGASADTPPPSARAPARHLRAPGRGPGPGTGRLGKGRRRDAGPWPPSLVWRPGGEAGRRRRHGGGREEPR